MSLQLNCVEVMISNLHILCAVKEILKLCPSKLLATMYKIPSFDTVGDFLHKVATVRGKLKKGGLVDVEAAARIVLHDWNEGMTEQTVFDML